MEGDKDILSKILEYDESLRGHIDSRNAMGQTALHEASARGFLSIINLLLDNDANINCKNSSGVSPLYVSNISFILHQCRHMSPPWLHGLWNISTFILEGTLVNFKASVIFI